MSAIIASSEQTHSWNSNLAWVYLAGSVVFIAYLLLGAHEPDAVNLECFALLAPATLLPGFLWARRPADYGFPLWPSMAITCFMAYAVPFISGHQSMSQYPDDIRGATAAILFAYFVAGTAIWVVASRRALPKRRIVAELRYVDDPRACLALLVPSVLFEANRQYYWLDLGELYSSLRTITMGLFLIGVFLLGSQLHRQSKPMRGLFILVMLVYCIIATTGIYLLPAVSAMLVLIAAQVLGTFKVPWKTLVVTCVGLWFLHEGKGDMRQEAWYYGDYNMDDPGELFDFYARWAELSYLKISTGQPMYQAAAQYADALDRVSLVQLTLKTVSEAPDTVPYLWGETYAQIPSVVIPRFLSPDKPWSLIGTHILNIRYGLQLPDAVFDTTIGWGPINEAYANFGTAGTVLLGMLMGGALGALGGYCRRLRPTAMPMLFAFTLIPITTNTEMTSTVIAATLVQQLIILGGMQLVMTRKVRYELPAAVSAGRALTAPS